MWRIAILALLICGIETGLRLGAASPDTRFTLPQYSLGYFWDTPLGWTGLVDGAAVNKDSVQFASLASFLRGESVVPVPPQDNVYVRFAAYPLIGSALAPFVGTYASFVLVNILFWAAGALATYALALRLVQSQLAATLAAVLVSTAPAFAALSGQALPYVASYAIFALLLLLFDRVGVFERGTSNRIAIATGLAGGLSFLFYDLFMLPAFVVVYGLLRRTPLRVLGLMLVAMLLPRIVWSGFWQLAQLPSYSHNETHPTEALFAWFASIQLNDLPGTLRAYAALAAHGALNIGAAFLFVPVALAAWELWLRRRAPEAAWFVAVAVAGFAPALFMLSTWPHIPRWYAYGFPAVYILAAAAAVRLAQGRTLVAVLIVLPAVVLANLDVLGFTKPMELLLFQPTEWSYLWSP